jgi:endoglucanase
MKVHHRISMLIVLIAWAIFCLPGRNFSAIAQENGFLHTDGSRILDANGNHIIITGISWFGLETENYAPHGLWARSLDSFLDQMSNWALTFACVQQPVFDSGKGINYTSTAWMD